MHDIHGNKGHCAKVKGHNAKVSVEAAKVKAMADTTPKPYKTAS